MKRLLLSLFLIVPFFLQAQDAPTFQEEFAGSLEFYGNRVAALAEAIPTDDYGWSPSEGVRSVGEVVAHVTGANYFFSMTLGFPAEGVDMGSINAEMSKEDAMKALKASVEQIVTASKSISDEALAEMVEFPGGQKYSKRSVMFIAFSHVSEHLGQMIAYARSNDVTPPWSVQQGDGE